MPHHAAIVAASTQVATALQVDHPPPSTFIVTQSGANLTDQSGNELVTTS